MTDRIFIEWASIFHDNVGPYRLAAEGIGVTYYSAFGNFGNFVEAVFYFPRIDVFPIYDDEVFYPVHNIDIAFLIHVHQITGMEPAVRSDDFSGFLFLMPVPLHDIVAAHHEFPYFARLVRPSALCMYFYFYVRNGRTYGEVLRWLIRMHNAYYRRSFREAIAFQYRMSVFFIKSLRNRLRNRRTAGNEHAHGIHG